jgi:hypothetical protein
MVVVSHQVEACCSHAAWTGLVFGPAIVIASLMERPFSSLLMLEKQGQPWFSPEAQLVDCLQGPIVWNKEKRDFVISKVVIFYHDSYLF